LHTVLCAKHLKNQTKCTVQYCKNNAEYGQKCILHCKRDENGARINEIHDSIINEILSEMDGILKSLEFEGFEEFEGIEGFEGFDGIIF